MMSNLIRKRPIWYKSLGEEVTQIVEREVEKFEKESDSEQQNKIGTYTHHNKNRAQNQYQQKPRR